MLVKSLKVLRYLCIYYLSAKMICFAIPKFLFMQFRILHWQSYAPLVEISKQQHMWSFFGRSYHYNLFIGLTEFLIGILIVFRRTRLIALLLSLGVCVNILVLNIEFGVDFAINHVLFDLTITTLLLYDFRKDLYKYFIQIGGKFDNSMASLESKFMMRLPYLFIVVLSVSYFIFAFGVKKKYSVNENIVGAYKIQNIKINDSLVGLGQGWQTKDPMLFIEYNNQFVLSFTDTLFMGRYIQKNDSITIYMDYPNKFDIKSINGLMKNSNSIIGTTSENRTFQMKYKKVDDQNNYLNNLYK